MDPYGGMENTFASFKLTRCKCLMTYFVGLTFGTPTLLAGDRSLANVDAHEIAFW
jgi:hypothetical protein